MEMPIISLLHAHCPSNQKTKKFLMIAGLLLGDLFAVMASFCSGFFLENLIDIEGINFKSFITYWPYLPAFIVMLSLLNLYPGITLSTPEKLRRFTVASFLAHAGIILSLFIGAKRFDQYQTAFLFSWVFSIPLFFYCRTVSESLLVRYRLWGIPAVIFGAGKTGKLVVDRLLDNLKIGYIPVLLLDDNPLLAGEYRGVPIVTGTNYGSYIASSGDVQTAIIAMPGVDHKRLTEIIVRQAMGFRRYLIIPDVIGISSLWMAVQDLNGILGLFTDQELLEPRNIAIKRLLDIVLSVIGMILLSPFFIVIALLIKLDSPGPIFYSHHRLGKNGKPIEILKFRSMYTNSAQMLETLLRDNPELQTEWQANFKLKNDPRITRVGAFLRRTSLDELPQLWNILKGDLSLVGPRPIIDNEVEKYGDNYWLLSKVKPGLSGLWQVSGRSETDYEQRVALDVYYIQSWSLWLDLYILLKTIVVVLKGDGAY